MDAQNFNFALPPNFPEMGSFGSKCCIFGSNYSTRRTFSDSFSTAQKLRKGDNGPLPSTLPRRPCEARLSLILGPLFDANDKFLMVADYSTQKVYQLEPYSGEVRAIPLQHCHPHALVFDPSINGFYVTCDSQHSSNRYHIRKKTFDGRIDEDIYTEQKGENECHLYRPTVLRYF